MDLPSIRLECSRLMIKLRDRGALEGAPLGEVAEQLALFCRESPMRLNALRYAYEDTDRGSKLARVLECAEELAKFAEKTPAPVHQSTRGGRTRGRR